MAEAKATRVSLSLWSSNLSLISRLSLVLLALPSLLTTGTANASSCNVDYLYPTDKLSFYYLDTINITYQSDIPDPTLSCWCSPARPTKKFQSTSSAFNGSESVTLNFSTGALDECWFELTSSAIANCQVNTETFNLYPEQRVGIRVQPAIAPRSATAAQSDTATSTASSTTTTSPSSATTTATTAAVAPSGSSNPDSGSSLSPAAKAGLAVSIVAASILAGSMAAFFYFRRRKHAQDDSLAGSIIDHNRRRGRKGPEKPLPLPRTDSSSGSSGRSVEPLYPAIQPVFDGYPGSSGYDDVRSLHSSTHLHSPTWPQSPTLSYNGGFYNNERQEPRHEVSDRDNLSAARLNSPPVVTTVVSYGPNPVTPTHIATRPATTADPFRHDRAISTDSREGIPPMPAISHVPSYPDFHYTNALPVMHQPPKPKPAPIVVSYGPNRVTPTPVVSNPPTVPPDESMINRFAAAVPPPATQAASQPAPRPITAQDRQFSFDSDEMLGLGMDGTFAPLPPYASTADFYAMEKGAIRKLAEPQAQAELPPTKDGFYHYTTDITEYELPGAAPQHEPQLPWHPYGNEGLGQGRGVREIDEQKFLLSDEDMANLRALKAKQRAAREAAMGAAREDAGPSMSEGNESYEMRESPSSR